MRMFQIQPSLLMPEGMEGAGGSGNQDLDPRLLAAMETQIQRSLATAFKKELPKLVLSNVQTALDGMVDTLTDRFLDKLQEQLPSDEEIAAMEAEENGNGAGEGEGAGGDGAGAGRYAIPPEFNARLLDYEKRIKQQDAQIQEILQARQDAEERAELADRVSQVQAALNSYPFVNDAAREVAFDYFINRVDRSEDGELIADDLPLEKFVETNMANLGGLISAKPVGGSGNTNHRSVRQEAPVFTMDQITPDMKKETRDALMSHAVTQLKGALSGPAQQAA